VVKSSLVGSSDPSTQSYTRTKARASLVAPLANVASSDLLNIASSGTSSSLNQLSGLFDYILLFVDLFLMPLPLLKNELPDLDELLTRTKAF